MHASALNHHAAVAEAERSRSSAEDVDMVSRSLARIFALSLVPHSHITPRSTTFTTAGLHTGPVLRTC